MAVPLTRPAELSIALPRPHSWVSGVRVWPEERWGGGMEYRGVYWEWNGVVGKYRDMCYAY